MHVWPTMSNPTPNTFCFSVVSFRKQIKKLDSKTSYEKHCAFKSEPCVCGTISKVSLRFQVSFLKYEWVIYTISLYYNRNALQCKTKIAFFKSVKKTYLQHSGTIFFWLLYVKRSGFLGHIMWQIRIYIPIYIQQWYLIF